MCIVTLTLSQVPQMIPGCRAAATHSTPTLPQTSQSWEPAHPGTGQRGDRTFQGPASGNDPAASPGFCTRVQRAQHTASRQAALGRHPSIPCSHGGCLQLSFACMSTLKVQGTFPNWLRRLLYPVCPRSAGSFLPESSPSVRLSTEESKINEPDC